MAIGWANEIDLAIRLAIGWASEIDRAIEMVRRTNLQDSSTYPRALSDGYRRYIGRSEVTIGCRSGAHLPRSVIDIPLAIVMSSD